MSICGTILRTYVTTMTKFQSKAREANSAGTIEATLYRHVCRMENIEPGDMVTLKVVDVEKQGNHEED